MSGWVVVAALAAAASLWWALPQRRSLKSVLAPVGPKGRSPGAWLLGPVMVGRGQRLMAALAAAAVVSLLVGGGWGLPTAALAALAASCAVGWIPRSDHKARAEQVDRELPTAVELMAAVLASGSPLRRAVVEVAAVSPPATQQVLGSVVAHLEVGMSEEQAWRQLGARGDWVGGWEWVGRDLAAAAASGTAVVSTLDLHAREGRRRRQELLERKARTVGVRSVLPLMVCFLPAFIVVGVVPIIAGLVLDLF